MEKLTLTIDSREQRPLDFSFETSTFNVVTEGMPVGDYWASLPDGQEIPLVFERKTLQDLFGTLTTGMKRFKRELERAKEHGVQMVLIIEGSMRDVAKGVPYSTVDGSQILKTVFSLWVRHDLIPVFCNDRMEMARFITETFCAVARCHNSPKKVKEDERKDTAP